jgi:anti-sigma-K factor RskA
MRSHDEMLDDVATYALGSLPPARVPAIAEHLRTCAQCAAEYRALRPAVTALAYSAQACATGENGPQADPRLKARVMAAVRRPKRAPAHFAMPLAAAACAALAVSAGLYAAALHGEVTRQQAAITDMRAAMTRAYPFGGGTAYVSRERVYVALRHLAPLPRGHVYQLWTLARGAVRMRPSVTFAATRDAVVVIPIGKAPLAALAISIEPAGGSLQPTTRPVAVVKLAT